ncbi:hypothetical protein LguiA_031138 [Lonicera macranthoides]
MADIPIEIHLAPPPSGVARNLKPGSQYHRHFYSIDHKATDGTGSTDLDAVKLNLNFPT